jgi:hypothetical protein
MKDIESLKKEQAEAKEKLVELVDFVNSEEFYTLTPVEKGLISQQRTGLEMYVSSLTKQLYAKEGSVDGSNLLWLSLLYGMMNNSYGFGSSSTAEDLKKQLEEDDFKEKECTDEQ